MRWGQGVPGTHQLHSNLKIVFIILFHTPLPYQFIQRFHILGIVDSSPPQLGTLVRPYYSYISLLYASTILPSSLVSGGGMSAPQFWSEIFSWWITVSFSSNTINIIILPYVFFYYLWPFFGGRNYKLNRYYLCFIGDSLYICSTTIYRLGFYTSSKQTKLFFLLIIGALIFFRNVHESKLLHATPSPRKK